MFQAFAGNVWSLLQPFCAYRVADVDTTEIRVIVLQQKFTKAGLWDLAHGP